MKHQLFHMIYVFCCGEQLKIGGAIENEVSLFVPKQKSQQQQHHNKQSHALQCGYDQTESAIGDVIICWTNVEQPNKKQRMEFQATIARFTSSDNNTWNFSTWLQQQQCEQHTCSRIHRRGCSNTEESNQLPSLACVRHTTQKQT